MTRDEGAEPVVDAEGEREALDRLEAALEDRARHDALRWVWTAGVGLVAIATSALLPRVLGPGPAGPLGRLGMPAFVWVGVVLMAVALAVASVWPAREPGRVALLVLGGAVIVGLALIGPLTATRPGPAPWLALGGALVAGVAALARALALATTPRPRP